MTFKNKFLAGLVTLGVASTTAVVGLDQACVFDDVTLFVESEKICFELQADYEIYKTDLIDKYNESPDLFLFGENGEEMLAVIAHEFKDGKKIDGLTIEQLISSISTP